MWRDGLLYPDDLIDSAEKIGRFLQRHLKHAERAMGKRLKAVSELELA